MNSIQDYKDIITFDYPNPQSPKKPIEKLEFEILQSTGSHEDYPCSQLLSKHHSPLAKGWQSERFCIYPQKIIFKLSPGNCKIQKMQILSHHFKIPTRIDIYCGKRKINSYSKKIDIDEVEFEKLGFIKFEENLSTEHKARELKTIHIEAEGEFIKMEIQKCHINNLNLYNQVGIVAINIMGSICDSEYFLKQLDDPKKISFLDPLEDPSWNPSHDNRNAEFWGNVNKEHEVEKVDEFSIQDLAFDVYQDRDIAKMIGSVLRAKDKAVLAEDFPLAKSLKTLFNLCKKAGEEIAKLDVTKYRAIEAEEYDTADTLKKDILHIKKSLLTKMKDLGLKFLQNGDIVTLNEVDPADEVEVVSKSTNIEEGQTKDRPKSYIELPPVEELPPPPKPVEKISVRTSTYKSRPSIAIRPPPVQQPQKILPSGLDDPESLTDAQRDEYYVPIQVYGEFLVQCLLSKQFKLREWALAQVSKRLDIWDVRMKALEKKNEKLKREAERLERERHQSSSPHRHRGRSNSPRGDHIRSHSKSPSRHHSRDPSKSPKRQSKSPDRSIEPDPKDPVPPPTTEEELLNQEMIRTGFYGEIPVKLVPKETFVNATFKIICKGMEDSREKVSILSIGLWDQLTRLCLRHKVPERFIFVWFENAIPLLLNKSSDTNPRIKTSCQDIILTLTNAYHKLPFTVLPFFLHNFPTKKNPRSKVEEINVHSRVISSRLDIILRVLHDFGTDDQEDRVNLKKKFGFDTKKIMDFVVKFLSHANSEVRECAVKIVVELVLKVGESLVAPFLKEALTGKGGMSPQIFDVIRTKIKEARSGLKKAKKQDDDSVLKEEKPDDVSKLKEELEEIKEYVHDKGDLFSTLLDEKQEPANVPPSKKVNFKEAKVAKAASGKKRVVERINSDVLEKTCLFCSVSDPNFTDKHYIQHCPMLFSCSFCKTIIEIQMFTNHLLHDCITKTKVKQCPRCTEAITNVDFAAHTARKSCKASSENRRCPLCHKDVPEGNDGWINHLARGSGCPGNPRKPGKKHE